MSDRAEASKPKPEPELDIDTIVPICGRCKWFVYDDKVDPQVGTCCLAAADRRLALAPGCSLWAPRLFDLIVQRALHTRGQSTVDGMKGGSR